MARKHTKEFKVQVCELVLKEGLKTKTVAEQFGLNQNMIYNWLNAYKTFGNEAFVGSGNLRSEDAKIRKLEKEIEQLRLENEILKKAGAYFAKNKEKK